MIASSASPRFIPPAGPFPVRSIVIACSPAEVVQVTSVGAASQRTIAAGITGARFAIAGWRRHGVLRVTVIDADGGVTVLMIEHVMQAVMHLAEHVWVLAQGQLIAEGNPAQVTSDDRVVEAYLGHGTAARLRKAAAEATA